ncbi:cytochrome b/b6 domain-containing protein [Streptomyces sp. AC512_CC834]|uniref:cytochrome b/b6 domain-containing protein n=1 Tax=Streptomyces sp. AC512_CC834 TaxID=2823691 RepID=UPI001C2578B5|nr:cytochrome b/b6 domain-containing protein [Streptomyces sp. AC512_CC834]
MPPRSDSAARSALPRTGRLLRFTAAARWAHHTTAVLAGVCIFTAACLYISPLAQLVGRRPLVTTVHEWSGIALPVPVLLGMASRALRSDLGRLNRFAPHDRRWLKAAVRRSGTSGIPSGKFNAGQKVYASWTAGAGLVMVGTGLLLWFPELVSLSVRMGATFVHDWLALTIGVVLAGHIWKAAGDPGAREGMWRRTVSRRWADREHRLWRQEMDGHSDPDTLTDLRTLPEPDPESHL